VVSKLSEKALEKASDRILEVHGDDDDEDDDDEDDDDAKGPDSVPKQESSKDI
jgi:hypothetical protein